MKLNLKLFGITKEIIGQKELEYHLSSTANVYSLRKNLKRDFPELDSLQSLMIAVNGEYAHKNMQLSDQDEVVLIPPVSGG